MSFARAFSALTAASAASMVAQILRGKLAALLLGPAGVGVFNQLTLMWNITNVTASLGTFSGIVQHGADALASDDRAALKRLTATFTILLAGFSLVIALIGAAFSSHLSHWLLHDHGKHGNLVALLMLGVPIGVTAQTWRALLSAARAVPKLVRSQIASDVGGAMVFAGLIVWLGLKGAILGFMASHLILFMVQAVYLRREFGAGFLTPHLRNFSWPMVRSNIGFGASGLLLIVLGNLGVLLVSRMIIARLGPEANGLFVNGWRIASVYLGAVTATTIGYFLPTLAATPTDRDMAAEVNATLRFYLGLLPPIMAGIMAGGSVIVWLILSSEFLPVAALLLVFVPAELLRILADTTLAQFLARRRLGPFTFAYLVQFGLFVGLAMVLTPAMGIVGAALAYGLAMTATIVVALGASRAKFGFSLDRDTWRLALLAALLLASVGLTCVRIPDGLVCYGVCMAEIGLWFLLSLQISGFRVMVQSALGKVFSRSVG